MANELVVIEQATALDLFKTPTKAQELVNYVSGEVAKELVELEKLDLSVGVNRNKYISLAAKVTKTKTYVEGIGKEIAADLKELPKLVDSSRKLIKDQLDKISEAVRKPVTDWEIADEARKAAEELARIMPYLHAEALEMNAEHDKLIAEAKAEAERKRIAYEDELKRQAAEQARLEAEQKAQQEIEAAAQREREAKEAAERAEREKQEAIERAKQEAKEAQELADREKQLAIEAERKKAQEAEQARLAEEERKRKEDAKRQEDKEHRRVFNREALEVLVSYGLDEDLAIEIIKLVASNQIPHMTMNY